MTAGGRPPPSGWVGGCGPAKKTSRHVTEAGRVDGVGFRYSVKQIATGFDVTGWVRNLPDGTGELRVDGDSTEVDAFLAAIAASHLAGYIRSTRQEDGEAGEPAGTGFGIRH